MDVVTKSHFSFLTAVGVFFFKKGASMKYHFNLHLISLAFSLYSYGCAYWLVKKEKKQAIVEVRKRNEQLYPSLYPWFSLYLSYAWKYQPWNYSLSSHEDLYNLWQQEKLFSVNHLLNLLLNVFSQINTGMKKDQFSFTLAMKDQ